MSEAAAAATPGDTLKCVWSRHSAEGRGSCRAHVPIGVALDAWGHERRAMRRTEGFFRFTWRGGTWLAYGAFDGQVRGVYCATHSAEREGRLSESAPAAAAASA